MNEIFKGMDNAAEVINDNFEELKAGKVSKKQEPWIEPSMINGWVNFSDDYNKFGFFKDEMGMVHLKGMIKSGDGVIFTLPVGYRPFARAYFPTMSRGGGRDGLAIINIFKEGAIRPGSLQGNDWLTLDGISFRAEN